MDSDREHPPPFTILEAETVLVATYIWVSHTLSCRILRP